MNILHIIPYFYPAWSYGGTPRVVFELCRELVRKGHNVTVYTTDVFDSKKRIEDLTPNSKLRTSNSIETEVEGIKVKYFKNISNNLAFNQKVFISPGISKALKENLKQFDIVHLHEFRTLQNAAAFIHLMKRRTQNSEFRTIPPYVLSAHGSVSRLMGKEFLKRLFDVSIGFKILKSAKGVIAVSEIEVEQYIKMGLPKDKISLIPNGINISEFENISAIKGNFRRAYNLLDKKILLFIGRLNAIKGIDFLLEAFALISKDDKDMTLVIAGPDDGYKDEIEKLIRHFNINKRVLLIDGLYGKDKAVAMADADIFIYPSKHEIFGIAPLEALMCGTSVIVTEICGCADFLKEANSGIIVKYGDIYRLSDAIKKILNEKEWAKDMAEKGREFIQKRFNWDDISEKTIELYKRFIPHINKTNFI